MGKKGTKKEKTEYQAAHKNQAAIPFLLNVPVWVSQPWAQSHKGTEKMNQEHSRL
jgi:glucan phosphoethanolaminetransferase (alkaline phosphatase superfamily)